MLDVVYLALGFKALRAGERLRELGLERVSVAMLALVLDGAFAVFIGAHLVDARLESEKL